MTKPKFRPFKTLTRYATASQSYPATFDPKLHVDPTDHGKLENFIDIYKQGATAPETNKNNLRPKTINTHTN